MIVSVFGNPLLKEDQLVANLIPELEKRFPRLEFRLEDPTGGLTPLTNHWIILDVAKGIDRVTTFDDLSRLDNFRGVSLHDYDLAMELGLLKKLGKFNRLTIIAVPFQMKPTEAFKEIVDLLKNS